MQIVHFDRLKPCPAKIRLDQEGDNMVQRDSNDDSGEAAHQVEQHTSRSLQLLDEDDDLAAPPPEIDLPEPDPARRNSRACTGARGPQENDTGSKEVSKPCTETDRLLWAFHRSLIEKREQCNEYALAH